MESAKQSTRISHGDFLLTIIKLSDQKLNVHVLARSTGQVFQEKELVLTRLNYQSVIQALKGEKKELKAELGEVDCDGCRVLELRVSFEHPLLPTIRECLPCKKIKDLSDVELITNSLIEYPVRLNHIREKLSTMKPKRFVAAQKGTLECRSGSDEPVVAITLPHGKYFITISYMAKVTNQWIYVNLDRNKTKLIDQQGYYLPNEATGNFMPSVLRTILEVPDDEYRVQFCVAYGNSYPATVTNAIMTAEFIEE